MRKVENIMENSIKAEREISQLPPFPRDLNITKVAKTWNPLIS